MTDYTDSQVTDLIVNKLSLAKYQELKQAGSLQADQLYQITDPESAGGSTSWGLINGTLSNQTDLQNALNAKANDSDVVKLTGDQTIAGAKIFNNAIKAKGGFDVINAGVTKGTNPASTQYWGLFRANDVNHTGSWQSTRLGIGEVSLDTNGNTQLILGVYKNEAGSSANSTIAIRYDSNGSRYATLSATPATSDNSTKIATTANVDAKITAQAVKLTGDQTIAGTKTFTSAPNVKMTQPNLYMQYTGISKGTAPTSIIDGWFGTIYDKNGTAQANKMAQIYHEYNPNGAASLNLAIFEPTSGSSSHAKLSIGYDANKNIFTEVPTPATSDNSTKIATTAFVKNQGYIGSANLAEVQCVIETYVNGTSWYRVWSDGWIEQGGFYDKGSTSTQFNTTVTFLKPMANTAYNVSLQASGMAGDHYGEYGLNVEEAGTNSFKLYFYTGSSEDGIKYVYWRVCGMGA